MLLQCQSVCILETTPTEGGGGDSLGMAPGWASGSLCASMSTSACRNQQDLDVGYFPGLNSLGPHFSPSE